MDQSQDKTMKKSRDPSQMIYKVRYKEHIKKCGKGSNSTGHRKLSNRTGYRNLFNCHWHRHMRLVRGPSWKSEQLQDHLWHECWYFKYKLWNRYLYFRVGLRKASLADFLFQLQFLSPRWSGTYGTLFWGTWSWLTDKQTNSPWPTDWAIGSESGPAWTVVAGNFGFQMSAFFLLQEKLRKSSLSDSLIIWRNRRKTLKVDMTLDGVLQLVMLTPARGLPVDL